MKKNGRTFDLLTQTPAIKQAIFKRLAMPASIPRSVSLSGLMLVAATAMAVQSLPVVAKEDVNSDVYSYGEETKGKITSQEYQALMQKTLENYVMEKKLCEPMQDNAKELCEVKALGNKNAMIAYLEAQYDGTLESLENARIQRVEATYNIALAMCKEAAKPEDCARKATKIKDNEIAKTRASPKTTTPQKRPSH